MYVQTFFLILAIFIGSTSYAASKWDDTHAAEKIEQVFAEVCAGQVDIKVGFNFYPYPRIGRRVDIGQNTVSIVCKNGKPDQIYIQARDRISDGIYLCMACTL